MIFWVVKVSDASRALLVQYIDLTGYFPSRTQDETTMAFWCSYYSYLIPSLNTVACAGCVSLADEGRSSSSITSLLFFFYILLSNVWNMIWGCAKTWPCHGCYLSKIHSSVWCRVAPHIWIKLGSTSHSLPVAEPPKLIRLKCANHLHKINTD